MSTIKYPNYRARRTRAKDSVKKLVRENELSKSDLIQPVFVVEGKGIKEEIPSMPEVYHLSLDNLEAEVEELLELGIPGLVLFGVPNDNHRCPEGKKAYDPEGITQRAIRKIKGLTDQLTIFSDVCLCAYTSHGHCGSVQEERVVNDKTLDLLSRIALSHAEAGVDFVAPSAMMDGQVKTIRTKLESNDFENVGILSYSAKYHSNFYGPFRDAAESAPDFGDRSKYQMDPSNVKEALREIELDIREGADIVMVKPAMAYMDVINEVSDNFDHPLAVYNVSGEYAIVKAASEKGWVKEKPIILETLTGFKRAGADMILTYHAKEAAECLSEL